MQNNNSRDRAGSAHVSPSARRRAANTGPAHRPSGFSAPDARRRSAPAPQPSRPKPKRFQQKLNNKRRRREHQPGRWRFLLLALGAALLVALLAALISAAARGAYHQLPKVTRIEDYTPEPAATLEPSVTPEAPGFDWNEEPLPAADEAREVTDEASQGADDSPEGTALFDAAELSGEGAA